jgi:hypothetical protein
MLRIPFFKFQIIYKRLDDWMWYMHKRIAAKYKIPCSYTILKR